MSNPTATLVRKLVADRKKLFILSTLVLVSLLLWGRLLLKKVPRSAVADPASVAQLQAQGSAAQPGDPGVGTDPRPVVHVDLPDNLARDLFHFDPALFPRVVEAKQPDPGPAKLDPQPADKSKDLEALKKRLSELKLQTTVMGAQPRALINGQVLMIGQSIEGFTLQQIMQRQVVVEYKGMQFRLKM